MIVLPVYDITGKEVDKIEIEETRFAKGLNYALLKEVIVMYENNQRQGNASTKCRRDLNYSGRKLWRQKGTGRARTGRFGSPHWRGGAVAFGPKPRDFYYQVPKKVKKKALGMAVYSKLKDGEFFVIDKWDLSEVKTKIMANLLKKLNIIKSCLVSPELYNREVYLASRNIEGVEILPIPELNAYEVFRKKYFITSKQGVEVLYERMKNV